MRGRGGFKHFLFLFVICVVFSLIFSDRKYVIVFPSLHFLKVKNEDLLNGTTELHNWRILVHNVPLDLYMVFRSQSQGRHTAGCRRTFEEACPCGRGWTNQNLQSGRQDRIRTGQYCE